MNIDVIKSTVIDALYILPAMLISLPFHESAHGLIANKLGDPTARFSGRITLNPLKHFDPIGFLCMLLCGFGWAKPVPVDTRNFRKPKRDMALTALAGPISNLLLAFIGTLILVITSKLTDPMWYYTATGFWYTLYLGFIKLITKFCILNIGLMIFNFIPIVPLDGSRILYYFLPDRIIYQIQPYERYIQIGLFALLIFGVLSTPLAYAAKAVFSLLYFIGDKVTAFI